MFKLDEPIGIYEETQHLLDAPAEETTFEGKKVPRGCILVIEEAAISDYTTVAKVLWLGKRDASGIDHWIKGQSGVACWTCDLDARPILKVGEMPIGRVILPTVGDDLYFTVYGLLYKHPT